MGNYEEGRAKSTKTELKKSKEVTPRIAKKKFQEEQLPLELFLSIRQKKKKKKPFGKNISTGKKRSKAQISKIIKLGGSLARVLGNMMGNVGRGIIIRPCFSFD